MSRSLITAGFSILIALASSANAAPNVVTSIKPVHSLVSAVMGDVGSPSILLEGAASPHNFSMKPRQAQLLQDADIVFWIGPNLETFLVKPLESLSTNNVELSKADGLALRATSDRHSDENSHGQDEIKAEVHDDHGHDDHGDYDMHVWLDPQNAIVMTRSIEGVLTRTDPENGGTYKKNAASLIAELADLQNGIADDLALLSDQPFMTYHDAYGYFTDRFKLKSIGSVTINPETPTSAEHVREIQQLIEEQGVKCIFTEPQFDTKLSISLADELGLELGTLDPLGAALDAGPQLYGQLITSMATSLQDCLKP